eukprot:11278466-Ditylum_brightwellii.AAC.1
MGVPGVAGVFNQQTVLVFALSLLWEVLDDDQWLLSVLRSAARSKLLTTDLEAASILVLARIW